MLVLSRLINESIMIGDVEVMVVDVRGDKVRLGITADKSIVIRRKEIRDNRTNHSHGAQAASPIAAPPPLSPAAVAADIAATDIRIVALWHEMRNLVLRYWDLMDLKDKRIAELEEQLKFATGFRVKEQV